MRIVRIWSNLETHTKLEVCFVYVILGGYLGYALTGNVAGIVFASLALLYEIGSCIKYRGVKDVYK